jgi:hypothetical protein
VSLKGPLVEKCPLPRCPLCRSATFRVPLQLADIF